MRRKKIDRLGRFCVRYVENMLEKPMFGDMCIVDMGMEIQGGRNHRKDFSFFLFLMFVISIIISHNFLVLYIPKRQSMTIIFLI